MTCSEAAQDVRCQALSVGPATARALCGGGSALRVHSVFPSTVNLQVEGTEWFVALCGPSGAIYPHAIVLERSEDFRHWGLGTGSQAHLVDGSIHLQGKSGEVIVNLEQAWRSLPRVLPLIARIGGAHRACVTRLEEIQDAARHDLSIHALRGASQATTVLGQRLCEASLALGTAALAFTGPSAGITLTSHSTPVGWQSSASLPQAVSALVGLGTGLTPSGDDFLCGFLAALRGCNLEAREGGQCLSTPLSEAVEQHLGQTGSISAFLIRCALQNLWPAPLVDLAEALAGDHEGEALVALDELCKLGHSSGADIATGFLRGLDWFAPQGRPLAKWS